MSLSNNGIIYYENKKYYRSANPYKFKGEYYEAIRQTKRNEIKELQDFIDTKKCYSQYVAHSLNDNTAPRCGKCANCLGHDIIAGIETPSIEEINSIQKQLNQLYIEITPRKLWPEIDLQFDSKTKIGVPNEIGIALCKYGDAGYGEMVSYDKYHANMFRDYLVEQSAIAL